MKFNNKNTLLIYCWLTEDPDIRLFCITEFADVLDPQDYFKTDQYGNCPWENKLKGFVYKMMQHGIIEDGKLWNINLNQVNWSEITGAFLISQADDIEEARLFKQDMNSRVKLHLRPHHGGYPNP